MRKRGTMALWITRPVYAFLINIKYPVMEKKPYRKTILSFQVQRGFSVQAAIGSCI